MTTQKHWDLIVRRLAGEASPEEIQLLETWQLEHPDHQRIVDEATYLWNARKEIDVPAFKSSVAFAKLKARLPKSEEVQRPDYLPD